MFSSISSWPSRTRKASGRLFCAGKKQFLVGVGVEVAEVTGEDGGMGGWEVCCGSYGGVWERGNTTRAVHIGRGEFELCASTSCIVHALEIGITEVENCTG